MQLSYTYICNNVFWSHELVTVMMPCGDCGWDKLLRYRIKWKIMRGGVRWGHRWGQIRHRFASVWGEARTQSVNGGETTSEGVESKLSFFWSLIFYVNLQGLTCSLLDPQGDLYVLMLLAVYYTITIWRSWKSDTIFNGGQWWWGVAG